LLDSSCTAVARFNHHLTAHCSSTCANGSVGHNSTWLQPTLELPGAAGGEPGGRWQSANQIAIEFDHTLAEVPAAWAYYFVHNAHPLS
jgi:hypothetical protein